MNESRSRKLFEQEINHLDQQINLAKAALYIAQEEEPDIDPEEYINALDTMAADVQESLPRQLYPLRIIQTINRYLYEQLNFSGNTADYYDPRNSFLNHVIDRRTGIPITLSLLYLEISQRIDFPMIGIGMPGHFLIRPDFEDVGIYVDAFNQGEILFPEDCKNRLSQIYGQPVELQPAFLAPVSRRQILGRMLSNLKAIYLNQGDRIRALAAIERILLLFPDAAGERRDRGILYYQFGRWQESRQDLEMYLTNIPRAEDAAIIRQLLERMSRDI
ncbi:transglutaminase-like domain-containing protein [Kamptonema sp. UHCC 0994]|uniref:SirB1 family protein n=1 Tax=Kamptonema sp. UHCC 0994 TaxID=3031329 RepID=UPI0023B959BE|nr:transglutaminase-like domain-containing protein [Kamptonema sp. UHCC 0994]MDF0554990.1 transglutaminase-like domain-containing protein [Kamptonema sp. UHCC 0994]